MKKITFKLSLFLCLFFSFIISHASYGQVAPPPPGITPVLKVCVGETATLNYTIPQSFTVTGYLWEGPNSFTSAEQNPVITNITTAAAGNYYLTVYTTNGPFQYPTAMYTIVVGTVIPNTPVITTTNALCENTTLQLNAGTQSGVTYNWTGPNGFSSTTQNPTIPSVTVANTGTYTLTTKLNGCSSLPATAAVTVSSVTNHTTTLTACGSYTWTAGNGNTYTSSGTYTYTNGCNTETLVLTISSATNHTTTASACGSYTWTAGNGNTYTSNGMYTYTNGCHTETLDLTIYPTTSHTTTVNSCGSYTWAEGNGTTYTASGNYIYTNGCHTETLALTITPSTTHNTTLSTCDSYTWTAGDGATYTESGNYTYTNGCHTETLTLTIAPTTSHTTTVSTCGSYTWTAGNGNTYTTSGTYTYTNGCHTETLDLTLTLTSTHNTTASVCGSYIWTAGDGATYTESGNYTYINGCHTETLALTITPITSNATTINTCGSYTWTGGNGNTYVTSGTYTYTTGCHTETLDLTITPFAITEQPTPTTICNIVGATASVSVSSSIPNVTYAWQYRVITVSNPNPTWITITAANAAVYANYTTDTLAITKTASLPALGTEYRVVLTASCGTRISDSAALTIITTSKAGMISVPTTMVCAGNPITFTVSGYSGTSLQWQSAPMSSAAAPGVFTDIPGAKDSSYTLLAQTNSNRSYRVVVTNDCTGSTAITATKTITVNALPVAGTITSGGGLTCGSGSSTLKVTGYTGNVQWEYSNDGTTFITAPTSTNTQTTSFVAGSSSSSMASYVINTITSNVYFRAKVTNGTCSAAYTTPVLYKVITHAEAGSISPLSTTICSGTGTTLEVADTVGTITWERSTNNGTTWYATTSHASTFATGNLTATTLYRARVNVGDCAVVYSDVAVVAMTQKPVAKAISANMTLPTGKTAAAALCTNDNRKVLTIANGYVGTIQWQTSTTSNTTGFTDIDGANGQSYTVTNPVVGVNFFRAKFTNSCGAIALSTGIAVYYTNCTATKAEAPALSSPFEVVAYPNPYSNTFGLALTGATVGDVSVTVYDMLGRLVEQNQITTHEVTDFKLGANYPSGVYNVVVTQGTEKKTLRVIKQ